LCMIFYKVGICRTILEKKIKFKIRWELLCLMRIDGWARRD